LRANPLLRTYAAGDESAILELFAATFGKRRDLDAWRWQHERAPEGPASIQLLDDDGVLAGHLAHVPFALWVDGRRLRVARGSDTMVRAEYRRRGAMRTLVEGFLASAHGCDVRLSFPNHLAVNLMQRHGGGKLLGRLPKWVRLLGASPELGPAGAPAGVLGALFGRLMAPRRSPLPVAPIDEIGPELDRLADESASFARCVRVRDAAYVRWRWRDRPGAAWTLTGARDGERLRGFAVLAATDSASDRRGRIVDLLAADPAALRSLLLDAVERLVAAGCRRVVCELQDPRPWARRQLLRAGFLPLRGDVPVICRALSPRAGAAPERLDNWLMTRGDTDHV
jgi:hypothetical protein